MRPRKKDGHILCEGPFTGRNSGIGKVGNRKSTLSDGLPLARPVLRPLRLCAPEVCLAHLFVAKERKAGPVQRA